MTTSRKTKKIVSPLAIKALEKAKYTNNTQAGMSGTISFSPVLKNNAEEMRKLLVEVQKLVPTGKDTSNACKKLQLLASLESKKLQLIDPDQWDHNIFLEQLVYVGFFPNKVHTIEWATAIFSGKNLPDVEITIHVPNADDLLLLSAFAGANNCFPNAPCKNTGIPCAALNSTEISWPSVFSGKKTLITLSVDQSVLSRFTAPPGYNPIPSKLTITAHISLFGKELR